MTEPDPNPRGAATTPPTQADPARWVRDHLDAVYRYARRRLAAADAEDATQQTFEGLVDALAKGRPPEDPGAWLLAVVRRRVADVWRRRARRPEPVSLPAGWDGFAREPLPDEALERRELVDLVHVSLGLLAPASREVLEARYRRGEGTAQVAARLGVTEKAVEMRLRRARAAFEVVFLQVGRDWVEGEPGEGGR